MRLKLSDEQVIQMGKLAIMASVSMGMGHFHYDNKLRMEDIEIEIEYKQLSIDYYQGRMVKFNAHKESDGSWSFADQINSEYQSWKKIYQDYNVLAEAVK